MLVKPKKDTSDNAVLIPEFVFRTNSDGIICFKRLPRSRNFGYQHRTFKIDQLYEVEARAGNFIRIGQKWFREKDFHTDISAKELIIWKKEKC